MNGRCSQSKVTMFYGLVLVLLLPAVGLTILYTRDLWTVVGTAMVGLPCVVLLSIAMERRERREEPFEKEGEDLDEPVYILDDEDEPPPPPSLSLYNRLRRFRSN